MLIKIAIIAGAGALGSVARWGVSNGIARAMGDRAHYGTLAVNVIGCLLFGLLYERVTLSSSSSEHLRLFFLVGFMGAFTTFSGFAFDIHSLHSSNGSLAASSHVLLTLLLGMAALVLGFLLGKAI